MKMMSRAKYQIIICNFVQWDLSPYAHHHRPLHNPRDHQAVALILPEPALIRLAVAGRGQDQELWPPT